MARREREGATLAGTDLGAMDVLRVWRPQKAVIPSQLMSAGMLKGLLGRSWFPNDTSPMVSNVDHLEGTVLVLQQVKVACCQIV